jgi:class 3 adenylate cyclase
VIGEHTLELVEGQFECRPLGTFSLKGKEKEVPAYEVLSVSAEAPSSASPAGGA